MPIPVDALSPTLARLKRARLGAFRLGYYQPTVLVKTYARLHVARLGAFRLNYYRPLTIQVGLGGLPPDTRVRVAGLTVRDYLDGEPNIATMRVDGVRPQLGMEVKIGLGSLDPAQLLFAGRVQMMTQVYEGETPAHLAWDLTCISHEWLLNRRVIVWQYRAMSATDIAKDIITRNTQGVTTGHVQPGLPTLNEFTLTNESVTGALDRLAARAGGYWFLDVSADLHFFTVSEGAVHPIASASPRTMAGIKHTVDLDPVRTRAIVEAGGSTTISDVAVGDTLIPVDDPAWYSDGEVLIGARIIRYTGVERGGGGAIVGTGVIAPTNAPNPLPAVGAGLTVGVYRYKVTFGTAGGETKAGPASVPVTVGQMVIPPATAPSVARLFGGQLSVGAYVWAVVFVDKSEGETALGPSSPTVQLGPIAPPSVTTVTIVAGVSGNLTAGAYRYKTTFRTGSGETTASLPSDPIVIAAIVAPGAPSATYIAIGNLSAGTYRYVVTFGAGSGETLASPPSAAIVVPDVPPPSGAPTVAAVAGSGAVGPGAYQYATTFVTSGGGETTPSPASAPITITAVTPPPAPSSLTPLIGGPLPAGEYRWLCTYLTPNGETVAGGVAGPLTLGGETLADPTVAPPMSIAGPSTPGLAGGYYRYAYHTVKTGAIHTGFSPFTEGYQPHASGMVQMDGLLLPSAPPGYTYHFFRTKVSTAVPGPGPIEWWRMPGSTTFMGFRGREGTFYQDNWPDADLLPPGDAAINTVTTRQANVALPISADSRVTARRLYRSFNGGPYELVLTIANNTQDSINDEYPPIGGVPPTADTAGRVRVSVTLPTSGDARVTSRRVYRTAAGSSDLKFVATISGNTSTSYTDTTADAALGASAPTTSTAGSGQATVTLPAIAGDARITSRRLYRTVANGSAYLFVATITDILQTTYNDNRADTSLGAAAPIIDTSGTGRTSVALPVSTDPLVTARKLYRTLVNGSVYKFVGAINDPDTAFYADNVADASLGADEPAANTADYRRATVALPVSSDPNVKWRRVYRTLVNGAALRLVATVTNNSSESYTDDVPDASLGPAPPGASAAYLRVALTDIPISPDPAVGVRKLYRTIADGTTFRFVTTFANNTTQTYEDAVPDASLGAVEPPTEGSGLTIADGVVLAGVNAIPVSSTAPFNATGGWVRIQSQVVRYAGKTGTTLTGIPAAGIIGALASSIRYGSEILAAPTLVGVPASGDGSIRYPIQTGEDANLRITRDDLAAQATMATLLGGDGIHVVFVQDRRLSRAEAEARGDAKLRELRAPIETVQYETRDLTTRSGYEVVIRLGPPTNISGTYKIQSVQIDTFDPRGVHRPRRTVMASSRRESFDAILRILRKREEAAL